MTGPLANALDPLALPALSLRDFALFQKLIEELAGIYLSEAKQALLAGRLMRRLRRLELHSFHDYYLRVVDDIAEQEQMLNCICINETRFFREPTHFDLLEQRLLPEWRAAAAAGKRRRRVRAWSAGCATGEEPYSLAMVLAGELPASDGWDVTVLATDVSTRVLELTANATWSIDQVDQIPQRYLKRFMLRGMHSQLGKMRPRPELRAMVSLAKLNLNDNDYPVDPFDIIFCRNVLIYFQPSKRAQVIDRLVAKLAPGGHLLLGHSEALSGSRDRLRSVMPTVYVKR